MTKTSSQLIEEARNLYYRVAAGQTNETKIMAWAGVCRAFAKASNAYRADCDARACGRGYTRFELNQFNNIDRLWWVAKAQVETLGRRAA